MARIDDYINAAKHARETLCAVPFEIILKRSGFASPSEQTLQIPFLDRIYLVDYPGFEFKDAAGGEKEVPLQEQVLILHYLLSSGVPPLGNQWISYREIPGASFYFGAFVKRAVEPLKKVFGQNLTDFSRAAKKLGAQEIENGDAGFEFRVFPAVPLQLILWIGDDEFPAEANILFDKNIGRLLSPEDVAWLSGMVVYRLMALAK